MQTLQLGALAVMAVFYAAYFTKMLLQRRKGVQTNQMGRGSKPEKVLRIERLVAVSTCVVVPVECGSILLDARLWTGALCGAGIGIAAAGVLVFIIAMWTMRDSWRAGIPGSDKTDLVTTGVYRFSRNPAFLGFDLMYAGLLLAFFNPVHLLFALFAMLMLHLQILQEEQFLTAAFGDAYAAYKKRTGRYFLF